MKYIICRACGGESVMNNGDICSQCDGACCYHVEDADIRPDHVVVPCNCPACTSSASIAPSAGAPT